jgi:hypothetical protein
MEWFGWYTVALMVTGILQSAIWVTYVGIPEREPESAPQLVQFTLERWNNALLEVLQR